MVREKSARYGPFGGLRVERVTKPDGRYVLYYTWPDGKRDAARGPDRPGRPVPWTPESGPPEDEEHASSRPEAAQEARSSRPEETREARSSRPEETQEARSSRPEDAKPNV